MILMTVGLIGLITAAAMAYLVQRHQEILRLQAQVLRARFTLEETWRQRRELVYVWCSLCEERGLLSSEIAVLRRGLARSVETPVSGDGKSEPLSVARWTDEKRLSRLIRDAYSAFLNQMEEGGAHHDFFRQYFRSLTRLEAEIGDAHELYNDSVRIFNRTLEGPIGWYFRHWERLMPKRALPPRDENTRGRRPLDDGLAAVKASDKSEESSSDPSVPAGKA